MDGQVMMINLHRTCWLFDGHGDTVTPAGRAGGEGQGNERRDRLTDKQIGIWIDKYVGGWVGSKHR